MLVIPNMVSVASRVTRHYIVQLVITANIRSIYGGQLLNGMAYLPQFGRNIIDALIRCWRVHLKVLTTPCCSSYLFLDHDNDMLDDARYWSMKALVGINDAIPRRSIPFRLTTKKLM